MPICWHSLTPQALVSCNPGIVCMNANKARLVLLQAKAGVPQNQWFLPAGEHTFKEYSTWKLSCMLACLRSHFSRVRLCDAMDCSPPGASVHGIDSPGKNTAAGGHALHQGIFPTQGQIRITCTAGGFSTNWAMREASKLSPSPTNSDWSIKLLPSL